MAGIKRKPADMIRELETENNGLRAEIEKSKANLEFVAMMTDVDLDDEEE